jgi:hypothetical protein
MKTSDLKPGDKIRWTPAVDEMTGTVSNTRCDKHSDCVYVVWDDGGEGFIRDCHMVNIARLRDTWLTRRLKEVREKEKQDVGTESK